MSHTCSAISLIAQSRPAVHQAHLSFSHIVSLLLSDCIGQIVVGI
jgi:hypothetical protein